MIPPIEISDEIIAWAFEWVDGIYGKKLDSSSADDLKTMLYLPDDPFHLIFGIGFFEGKSEIYPRTDSGYLKTILSIGVVFSLLLYLTLIYLFTKTINISREFKILIYPILIFLIIVEIKEPFIYQNFMGRIIMLLIGASLFFIHFKPNHKEYLKE